MLFRSCFLAEDLFARADKRGLSLFARTGRTKDVFVLQARATDVSDAGPIDVPFALSRVVHQAIQHCPGCGVDLLAFYSDHLPELRRDDLRIRRE